MVIKTKVNVNFAYIHLKTVLTGIHHQFIIDVKLCYKLNKTTTNQTSGQKNNNNNGKQWSFNFKLMWTLLKGDLQTIFRFSYLKVYKLITLGTKFNEKLQCFQNS